MTCTVKIRIATLLNQIKIEKVPFKVGLARGLVLNVFNLVLLVSIGLKFQKAGKWKFVDLF